MCPNSTVDVFFVPHTHWDREWHQPFQVFRLRLVRLIDRLLGIIDRDPAFRHFHLDGQTVVLEDYLEMRPERARDMRRSIRTGRIGVGPWYVLPDEFLVDGESIIRNLQRGMRIAAEFGRVTKVGYLPDQFGHISQMPQILRGFGIDTAVVWRGLEYDRTVHNEFIWKGPDGSSILGVHLPARGYGGLTDLSADPAAGMERVKRALDFLAARAASGCVLLLNGDDHAFPDPGIPEFIAAANTQLESVHIVQGSLEEFFAAVRNRVDRSELAVIAGELNSPKDTRVLQSVYSARMPLKRANRAVETELLGWAEPTSALLIPLGVHPPRGELRTAWKWLLRNHPHDSIGGCSVDQVHREMETRFAWSEQIARGVSAENLKTIAAAVEVPAGAGSGVVAFNPTNFPGDRVIEVELPEPLPAGPVHGIAADGRTVPAEAVTPTRVRLLGADIPAFGYATYRILPGGSDSASDELKGEKGAIENAHYRVAMAADGTIEILDKETGEVYSGGLRFEDRGDRGDEYTFDPIANEEPIFSALGVVTGISVSRLRAVMQIRSTIEIPAELDSSRDSRVTERIRHEIETEISLYPGEKRIDFRIEFVNAAKDHRLRVLFPTGIRTDVSRAAEHFDLVKRPIQIPAGDGWSEAPYSTKHLDRFVYLADGKRGFAVLSGGVSEYEVLDDQARTVALTLVRSIGWLARRDLVRRVDEAGPIIPTPEAQCLGPHIVEFALTTTFDLPALLRQSALFNLPARAVPVRPHPGILPPRAGFLSVLPKSLAVTAVKPAEDADLIVVRVVNLAEEPVQGRLETGFPLDRAVRLNLNEEPLEVLQPNGDAVAFPVPGKRIVTLGLSPKEGRDGG